MMPGALGKAIPVPKPAAPAPASGVSSAGGRGGGSVSRPPQTYSGGAFLWPVVGGGNYVSQGYNGGHGGLDIAADSGSEVRATASGSRSESLYRVLKFVNAGIAIDSIPLGTKSAFGAPT